jgi:cytochrome c oxidase subunit 2
MLSFFRRGSATGLVALAMMLATGNAMAAWDELNLPVGVTPISRDVYDLHMLVLWVCVIIGIIVFGVMFVSIVLHRKAAGHKPAQFHHSTFAEIVWTVIPSVILLGLAIPATKTLIDMEDTSEAELTLKVTGYQWLWKYEYVEDGVSFYSSLAPSSRAAIYGDPWQVDNYLLEVDNPVVLPVGKKVRILLTADDVIHAWWMPALGVKKDAIPGFVNEMWVIIEEPGTYRGQCAELCGKDHGFMPIVVEAKSDDEYKQWVAAYKAEQKTQLAATTISSQ